jgi:DNA-binding response OmpR family regulator
MQNRILVVGNDDVLQKTRVEVLKTQWTASYAYPKEALRCLRTKRPDVLVLCHTLTQAQREGLIRRCRDQFPEIRILALEGGPVDWRHLGADATVKSLAGPQTVLDAIRALIANPVRVQTARKTAS